MLDNFSLNRDIEWLVRLKLFHLYPEQRSTIVEDSFAEIFIPL